MSKRKKNIKNKKNKLDNRRQLLIQASQDNRILPQINTENVDYQYTYKGVPIKKLLNQKENLPSVSYQEKKVENSFNKKEIRIATNTKNNGKSKVENIKKGVLVVIAESKAVAYFIVSIDGQECEIIATDNVPLKDSSGIMFVSTKSVIFQSIIRCIHRNGKEFDIHINNKKIKYKILYYDIYDRQYYKPKRIVYNLKQDSFPIWVYKNFFSLTCSKYKHKITTRVALVKTLIDLKTVELPVSYCFSCEKYFVDIHTLNQVECKNGRLLAKFVKKYDEKYFDEYALLGFEIESDLHRWGYDLSQKNNLSITERRKLLQHLIDNDIMEKFEIQKTIINNINLFQHRESYVIVCQKWKEDLYFVDNYHLDDNVIVGELKRN